MALNNQFLVSRRGLFTWVQADAQGLGNAASVSLAKDGSGNANNFTCASNYPVNYNNVLNGKAVFRFDGSTTNPLVYTTGSGTLFKHFFIVAGYIGATFAGVNGLVSDLATLPVIVGAGAGLATFYDLSYTQSYNKNNRLFANNNQQAPMNKIGIIEVQIPAGIGLTGLQVGKDRNIAGRIWNGDVAEWMFYTNILTDFERFQLFRYFAREYQIWQQNSAGVDVFPITPEWGSARVSAKDVLVDYSFSGTPTGVIKRSLYNNYGLAFQNREEDELNAYLSFYSQKFPLNPFVYRDYTTLSMVETNCYFDSETDNQITTDVTGFSWKCSLKSS